MYKISEIIDEDEKIFGVIDTDCPDEDPDECTPRELLKYIRDGIRVEGAEIVIEDGVEVLRVKVPIPIDDEDE